MSNMCWPGPEETPMGRLNRNQKHRKRRRRRRERDKRWMARGVAAGCHLVTGYRRFKKLFGELER